MKQALISLALLPCLASAAAFADAQTPRFSAGGYYRIMTRPDFEGGDGKLGYSELYGRLLNEGPYGMLQLKLDVLQADAAAGETTADVNVRIEGGSFQATDAGNGNLGNFRVSQLYVQATNILLDKVTWRLGTLWYYPGQLGLYDDFTAQLLYDTVGLSGFYHGENLDLLIAAGDSGYSIRGSQYDTIFTGAVWARLKLPFGIELGAGGQFGFEPSSVGNPDSPNSTPGINYQDYLRHEVVKNFLANNPGMEDNFPRPVATSSTDWNLVGYLGFGNLGPLSWNNLFMHYTKLHPDNFYVENYQGRDYTIFLHDLTDQRTQLRVGDEAVFNLVPGRLDAALGLLAGKNSNGRNTVAAGEDNLVYASAVLRLQYYLTRTVHLLGESSAAREKSLNGNLYREHYDSIFQSTNGAADSRGLEHGDSSVRNTFQEKVGVVFNPAGPGIWTRPSLRLLYGLQYSSQQAAFGNNFQDSLDQYNQFASVERHWHSVVALEAEGWF